MVERKGISVYRAIAALALGLIALYLIYTSPAVGILIQAVSALFVLFICGLVIRQSLGLKGGYGFYLFGGKTGIKLIERISKSKGDFWEELAMWGLTLGLGVASYWIVKGRMRKSTYAIGLISLVLIDIFVLPYITYGIQFISIPNLPSFVVGQIPLPTVASILAPQHLINLATMFVFGFVGYTFLAIVYNSALIIYSLSSFLANIGSQSAALGISSQVPGVVPLIPGITTPLLAGIISLFILVAIHEFSHGVLARRAKVRIKSIGVLLWGFIPIGGYVEPDEKKVMKLKPAVQTYIFSAGIAINFVAMLVFFVATFFMAVYVVPHAYSYGIIVSATTPGYPANGILKSGMVVIGWNGKSVTNLTTLESAASTDAPNSIVTVNTATGSYAFKAVAAPYNQSKGLIGVTFGYKPILASGYARLVYFLFTVVSLSMLLNFLVAVVNLLPIPGFDGWRIYHANVKSTRLVNTLAALIIILLALNVIPLLFNL
jgi:membrane-associated protease RseP (regulator of RpoE activity)